MNLIPQSDVMYDGMPCLENTWIKNNFASLYNVMMSTIGTNMSCLDS